MALVLRPIVQVFVCLTNTNPNSPPKSVLFNCSAFEQIPLYRAQTYSSIRKYYFRIKESHYPDVFRPNSYTIIYYDGSNPSGQLYVTSNKDYLLPPVQMTKAKRNTTISLSTNITEDKYFYLSNSNYYYYSSYIYFLLEDNAFSLNTSDIKYCQTKYSPDSSGTIALSDCIFNPITYYSNQTSSSQKKYYYKLSSNSSYDYTIIYYSGSHNYGSLNVIINFYDFLITLKMTKVNRNSNESLPTTTSDDKYFYLTNKDYSDYFHKSSYIHILLEDNNFGLNYSNVKYCHTFTEPEPDPEKFVCSCNFNSLEYYRTEHYSNSAKFYYEYYINRSTGYIIISYNGNYSSGSLYVTSDYKELSKDENSSEELSILVIVCIVLASLFFLALVIFLLVRCCSSRKSSTFEPLTQSFFAAPPIAYPQPLYNPAAPYQA